MANADNLHPIEGVRVSPGNTQAYQIVLIQLARSPVVTFRRIEGSSGQMQAYSGAEIPDYYNSPEAEPFATLRFSRPTPAAPKSAAEIADVILSLHPPEGFRLKELTIISREGDGSVYEFFREYQPLIQ